MPLLALGVGVGVLQLVIPVETLGPIAAGLLKVTLFTAFILGTIALAKRRFALLEGISVHSL